MDVTTASRDELLGLPIEALLDIAKAYEVVIYPNKYSAIPATKRNIVTAIIKARP